MANGNGSKIAKRLAKRTKLVDNQIYYNELRLKAKADLLEAKNGLEDTIKGYKKDIKYFGVELVHEIEPLCNEAYTDLGEEAPYLVKYVIPEAK